MYLPLPIHSILKPERVFKCPVLIDARMVSAQTLTRQHLFAEFEHGNAINRKWMARSKEPSAGSAAGMALD
jgi:hypothetical protein